MSWESLVISLLAASLVRPFALVAVAWVMLRVLRVSHPASRHAVWTAVLFGIVLLPFVSVLTPHWKLPVLPAKQIAAPVVPAVAPAEFALPEPVTAVPYAAPESERASDWPSIQTLVLWGYFAGVMAMVAYRSAGSVLLRRVMSRATPVRSRIVLESSDVLTPVAAGVLRPVVILPAGWRGWSADTKRAVLAHEFSHLRRHDALVSSMTWWVRSLLWFHPLAWWVSREVSDLAEVACDLAAVEHAGNPAGYSRTLIGFAEAMNSAGHRVTLPGLAMASGSKIDRRIEQVFELSDATMRKLTRPALVLGAIGVPLVCVAAVVGFGERGSQRPSPPVLTAPPIETPLQAPVLAPPADPPITARQRAAPQVAARPAPAARPEFEVASIKLSSGCTAPRGGRGGRGGGAAMRPVTSSPGRLNVNCQSVMELIQMAYDRYSSGAFQLGRPVPIEGAPAWTQSDRYTIEAKGDVGQKEGIMMGPMMQALLKDRFRLKIHREAREVPVYEMSAANGGPKLEPFRDGSCDAAQVAATERDPGVNYCDSSSTSMSRSSPNQKVHTQRMSLEDFCRAISSQVGRPVINKTGITGLFNFTLEYAQEANSDAAILQQAETASPGLREQMLAIVAARANGPAPISIFTALQQQLGLKLEKATGPGDFLIIDSVERPSEN